MPPRTVLSETQLERLEIAVGAVRDDDLPPDEAPAPSGWSGLTSVTHNERLGRLPNESVLVFMERIARERVERREAEAIAAAGAAATAEVERVRTSWADVDKGAAPSGCMPWHSVANCLEKMAETARVRSEQAFAAERERVQAQLRQAALDAEERAIAAALADSDAESVPDSDSDYAESRSPPRSKAPVRPAERTVVTARLVGAEEQPSSEEEETPLAASRLPGKARQVRPHTPEPGPKKSKKAPQQKRASKKVAKSAPKKESAKSPMAVDAADAFITRILATGPKPAAPSGWVLEKDANLVYRAIKDVEGMRARIRQVCPNLPEATVRQHQRGIVAMFGFHTDQYSDLASLCVWYNALEPPKGRTKRQAVADFLAAHYYPELGATKLDVNGAKHMDYVQWAEALDKCLGDFLYA